MRLTLVQMFKRSVNGHIFKGKNRLVKPVSHHSKGILIRDYERQEENMLLLRHPYLTLEQSAGHARDLGKREQIRAKWDLENWEAKQKPNITIEQRLEHLNVKNSWD